MKHMSQVWSVAMLLRTEPQQYFPMLLTMNNMDGITLFNPVILKNFDFSQL